MIQKNLKFSIIIIYYYYIHLDLRHVSIESEPFESFQTIFEIQYVANRLKINPRLQSEWIRTKFLIRVAWQKFRKGIQSERIRSIPNFVSEPFRIIRIVFNQFASNTILNVFRIGSETVCGTILIRSDWIPTRIFAMVGLKGILNSN